jgi:hypothetical protein
MVRAGAFRRPWQAAGLAAVAATALAGCGVSSGSGSSAPSASSASGAASGTASGSTDAQDQVQLAAKTTAAASSVTGTMTVQATAKPGASASPSASGSAGSGAFSMTATFAERLRPSLLASTNVESLSSSGTSLPSGLSEIITPSTFYLKWSYLTQELHLSKPWLAIPVAQISQSSGINLGQILGSVSGSPLTGTQLLAGATSVRQTGTGTVNGVAVTEYSGTLSLHQALSSLSGSAKTQLQQAIAQAGFSTADFTVWIDGKNQVRKSVVTETGTTVTETSTTTITSIGQPVTITPPAASETTPLPSTASPQSSPAQA